MPFLKLSFVAALFLGLTGCHEYAVEPEPAQPQQPGEELAFITLKGPGDVTIGQLPSYRAQEAPGAVRYDFRVTGPVLALETVDRTPDDRFFDVEVTAAGTVELSVTAYDIDDVAIAASSRTIVAQ